MNNLQSWKNQLVNDIILQRINTQKITQNKKTIKKDPKLKFRLQQSKFEVQEIIFLKRVQRSLRKYNKHYQKWRSINLNELQQEQRSKIISIITNGELFIIKNKIQMIQNSGIQQIEFIILIKKHYPSLDNEKVTLYEIEIIDGDKVWRVEKRFKQFKQLNQRLSEYFGDTIPLLPKQTYTTFIVKKTEQEIIERRKGLEEYLKQIIQNEQIVNSIIFKEFIQSPSFKIPKLQLDSVRTFDLGLRDFYFYEDALFVLLSEMSPLNRATTSLKNIKFPWQEEIEASNIKPLGYLDCMIGPQMIWRKKYDSQPILLSVIKDNILVGLDNGIINHLQFKAKKHLLSSNDYQQHTSRIMGLHFYGENIYSVSKDQRYKVRNIKKGDIFIDIYHKHELTCLKYDEATDFAFIGDRGGIIYAYHQATLKISLDTNLQFIRDLIIQKSQDTIIAIGFQTGQAIILSIVNQVIQLQEATQFKNKIKSRCIAWSLLRGEVYIGNQEGYVTVWDIQKKIPICENKLHNGPITKIYWNEEEEMLYTGSKDKSLKITFFNKNKRETQQYYINRKSDNLQNVNL
ncbi:unnamed protein product [Paramecium sonneborni]|uniref:PX domain-containing protein n=1 Tax=Paramecium sonneborni TaxID=65129 RepID=A0A8S1MPR9_9CILI|nr:unnamed protein product [Paramecium sonneborni]